MAKSEIDKIRKENRKKTLENKVNVHNAVPEIVRIDEKLAICGVRLVRCVIDENNRKSYEEIKEEIINLQEEKRKVLTSNGFSENFMDEIYACLRCNDSGFKENKPCQCLSKLVAKYRRKFSNVVGQMAKKKFNNFDFSLFDYDSKVKKSVEFAYDTLLNFINISDKFTNIFITGESGTGKTFISLCVANKILENEKDVYYQSAYNMADAIDRVKFDKMGSAKAGEILKFAYTVDYLIIDDLGAEFSNSIIITTLLNIIDYRIMKKRPIIINSNLGLEDIKCRYGLRVASRIAGEFKMLRMLGRDLRLKNKVTIEINEIEFLGES
jgi:DNA replication protein DnaC